LVFTTHKKEENIMEAGSFEALQIFTGKVDGNVWSHSLCDGEHHITYTTAVQFDTAGNVAGAIGGFSDMKECDGSCHNASPPPDGYPFGDPESWIKTSLWEKVMIARMRI